jgi:putative DNA primase/helicase
MSDCLTAAIRYAKRGWKVFPLDGKRPYEGTNGFHDASTDLKQIRRWWKEYPSANVGLACDHQRGPIVIDLDKPNANEVSAKDFIAELDLPETRSAQSRKGRLHLYFDAPIDPIEITRRIRPFKHDSGKKYALDILGTGGYVVAPPSIHPDTGQPYRWTSKIARAPFPAHVLDIITIGEQSRNGAAPPLPDIIGEGERDTALTSLAGTMRRRGADEETILEALRGFNLRRVNPPLPDKDLRRIAKSIARKPPAGMGENLTDLGNARRFIAQHHLSVRSIKTQRDKFLIWDGVRWTPDNTGEVERLAKGTVRSLYLEASHASDEDVRDQILKHASKSESAGRIRSIIELAATEPEISISSDALDADILAFNVENGTINLRTGELRPHDRDDLITRLAPVEYNEKAKAPRWNRFMSEVMQEDEELVTYIQTAVGYSLTGDTREQCLFFCYGQGANGKSQFFETLRALLGGYGQQSDFNSFMASRGDGPRNDLARMRGARFVTASEADSDRGFDTRIIKMLTGDDTIVARRLYEELFEFMPQHKLWLAANHKPIVREVTEAFWRRMRLVPFERIFKKHEREGNLAKKMIATELPGILNWALEGCRLWHKKGLIEPRAVRRATHAYKDENDLLGEFLVQRCVLDEGAWTSTIDLYRTFTEWWLETRGQRAASISMGWFSRMLGERPQLKTSKREQIRGWRGIAVLKEMRR